MAGRAWHVAELGQSVPPSLQPLGREAHPPDMLTVPRAMRGGGKPWGGLPCGQLYGFLSPREGQVGE